MNRRASLSNLHARNLVVTRLWRPRPTILAMSHVRIFTSIVLLSLLLTASAGAQTQTGNIAGLVTDSSGRAVLVGAQVQVEGQRRKVVTDESGRYLLLSVPAGTATVTVSYLGLAPAIQRVTVVAGGTTTQDFSLSPAGVADVVTVSASPIEAGQARALNDQKNSVNLVNLVASDQIGSFPDANAAEATQRIPGIVVQRDQGEGRYVLIRGTEPRLSATTINGDRIGTTENTSRQIPLDTIPADLLGAIEITKVLTPDVEADSIGGRVNLITKRAPAARHVALTLGTGYNTLVSDDLKDYNGTYGDRLLGGRLGVIVSGNYYQNNRGSQDLEPSYNANTSLAGLDLRDYVLTRTRKGGTFDLDYTLAPGSSLFLRGLRTEYQDRELRHRMRSITTNGRLERALRDRTHNSSQTAVTLGGNHVLAGSWLLDWRSSYSRAALDTPYRLEATFRQTGATFAPNVTADSIDPSNIQASPQNQNLNSFNFIQNAIQNDKGRERNVAAEANLSVPHHLGSSNSLFKAGVKVRQANRSREVESITQTPPSGTTLKLLDYTNTSYAPGDNYLGGKYPEFATQFPDRDLIRALSHGTTLTTVVSPTGDSGNYTAKETVTAGYLMDEIALGAHTMLVPGVRIESTATTYGAPQYQLGAGGAVQGRSMFSGTNDYTNVMPGLHLRHELGPDSPLRLSYSRTLARPNYNDLAPFILQDSTALTISKGNPALRVTTSNNIDASVEHYFHSVGIASAGVFYKNLDHYIYATTLDETIGSDKYRVSQPINGETANVYGLELTLVRRLDFLPGALDGFTAYANYTGVRSKATLPAPRGKAILPGQAEHMGNVALGYEKKGLSVRLSSNYQGAYILAVGADATKDNWLDGRTEVDLSLSQKLGRRTRLFVDMLNLGNQPYRVWAGDSRHPIQEERYKMWAIAGVKLDY